MFPRFMKWDIGKLLIKGQGVDLSGPVNFQIKVDRLRSFEYEREMMGADVVMFGDVQADVVDCVGGDDAFVEGGVGIDTEKCDAMHTDDLECGFGVVREECSSWEGQKAGSPVGGNAADVLRSFVFVNNSEGVKGSRVDEYVNAIAILELDNKRKGGMITLLEGEVDGLKRKLEAQVVNIVGGFECVLGIKNDEVEKLKKENIELRRSLLVLEDQIADRNVHVVTQAFRDVQVRRGQILGGCDVVDSVGEQRGRCAGSFLKVDLCDMDDGLIVSGGQTSFVRNIKNKVRQEKKFPDFEYPILNGRNKKSVTDAGVVVRSDDFASNSGIIDVVAVVVKGNKWSGFDINNRLGVWKMMTVEEKSKIKQGYERHGDRAVMWEDRDAGVVVDFTDVKNIIRQSAVCGNVTEMCVLFMYELLQKERVTDVMEQTLREFELDEQSIRANFNSTLEAVTKCPQQKPGTLDCGVLVCAIMRQYVHRADVERSLHGSNCIILRANMVKAFVNDPTRGLKE
ncbi:hypothetical protein LOK49_LG07G00789 [Camellia lanceoleosa]|uniref:Uncharacterized protein n=1 Tax=Camellia lanceoleosa TaxID=1840588 RepID=A0ACC0H532_9ERIC|nr:hypothetical protein LOK49_LG07G00789 [Camellia lanceoleosa]